MNRKLEGIEPIIAVVILVAVTLVLAIAVVGWIMGWWGATGGPTESLKITPINATNDQSGKGVIYLYVCNTGTGRANITSVTVTGIGTTTDITSEGGTGGGQGVAISQGECKTIKATLAQPLTSGAAYDIIVSTAAGNTYKTVVRAT
ncbi:MAG: archaellin/type IV pilin N-terminal domain-containing protein [Desulfurococcaceae archaeon]